jgi:O-antigen/teichoic acid export membrane protein
MQSRWTLVKNSAANFLRGSAAAVMALLLPPILVRHMGSVVFGVWALVLQIAAYINYLDLGLQTAVGRYVAFTTETRNTEARDGIFSTALAGLSIAAGLGIVLVLLAAVAAHWIFPAVPSALIGPMRWATVIVGISMALGLPASAFNGVFVGLQKYEIPALTVGGAKLLSAIGLIVAALEGKSLVSMAIILGATNIASYAVQYGVLRRILPDLRFRLKLIRRRTIRELSGYCFSLSVWSLSMLMVNGFDLILVGRFQFSAVAPYAVAATAITFLAGMQNSVFGVIMPHAATLQARENSDALGQLLLSSTRLSVLLLLATGLPLIVFASSILRIWIGPQFALGGSNILTILVIANMVRLTSIPYASILIGTGQQRLVTVSPLMEGITNFFFSIVLGYRYGAIGVAWGTLIGSVMAVLANILYNMKRTRTSIHISRYRYVIAGILFPALCGIPVYLVLFFSRGAQHRSVAALSAALAVSLGACALLGIRGIFTSNRRANVG